MKTTYDTSRRRLLICAGGGLLITTVAAYPIRAAATIDIVMSGSATGSHVWFRPQQIQVQPGQTVRWTNQDAGNVHTVTAYHPINGKRLGIPETAEPWDSGYLMPNESFMMTFDLPGEYNYFCIPHERAGMVGRIVVGDY